ncbi:MAG: peptide chain release factor N(5)-glutamine methyltransferase [Nitrospirota bacterium]
MKAFEQMKIAIEMLRKQGIESAEKEAEIILSHCLDTDLLSLHRDNPEISDDVLSRIRECLKRRSAREPMQYIIGYTEFYGLRISVGPGVLIPRPETELLVEEAVRMIAQSALGSRKSRIVDLCTGTGCIAIALAREFPVAEVFGTDISGTAIRYARQNAGINGVGNVHFLQGSFFDPLRGFFAGSDAQCEADMVIVNPPYIPHDDIVHLQPEIRDWEPTAALDGGRDGLDAYRLILSEAGNYLQKNGILMLELGFGQAERVREMAENKGYRNITLKKDYAGIKRIFVAHRE